MSKKKCPVCKKGTPLWFISWADMATLLMCFFVIIFSMSTINATKFRKLQGTMKNAFGLTSAEQINVVGGDSLISNEFQREVVIARLTEKIELMVKGPVDNGQAEVEDAKSGIFVRLSKQVLFNPGSIKIHPESELLLSQVATLLQSVRNEIQVMGMPDDSPPPPLAGLLTPWAAGLVEAQAVASFLVDEGGLDPKRVKVVSYRDRPGPAMSAERKHDKLSLAVEIGIMKTTEEIGGGVSQ